MKRRAFIHRLGHTLGAAAAGGVLSGFPTPRLPKKLDRIGLELYAVRHAMAQDPERTLAAIRAIGYTDVELLWSFNNFNRTPTQVAATLKNEGLRAPSAHMSADTIFVGWERSLAIAKQLGHEYLIVPDFEDWTKRTIDDWLEWADKFNAAGAVARRAGIWLAFHNEAYHQKPIDGKVPYALLATSGMALMACRSSGYQVWLAGKAWLTVTPHMSSSGTSASSGRSSR